MNMNFNDENIELDELLKVNKQLVENKKELHERKVRSYTDKSLKIKQLITSTTDEEQKIYLQQKLKTTQNKRKESITKLKKINVIELQMSNADSMRDSISEEKLNIIGKSMSKLKTKSNNMKEMPKPKHKNMLSQNNLFFSKQNRKRVSTFHGYRQIKFDQQQSLIQKTQQKQYQYQQQELQEKLQIVFRLIDKDKPKQIQQCFAVLREWLQVMTQNIQQFIVKERKLLEEIDNLDEQHRQIQNYIRENYKKIMKNMKIKTKDTNRKDSNIDILSEQLASSIGKFMEDKKTEILNITQQVISQQSKLNQLQMCKQAREQQIQVLSSRVEKYNKELKERQYRMKQYKQKCDQIKKQYEDYMYKEQQISNRIQELEDIAALRKKAYDEIQKKYDNMKTKKKKLMEKIQNIQQEIGKLEQAKEGVQKEIKKRNTCLHQVNGQLKQALYAKEETIKHYEQLDTEIQQSMKTKDKLQVKIKSMSMNCVQLENQEKKLRECKSQLQGIRDRIQDKTKYMNELAQKIGSKQQQLKQIKVKQAQYNGYVKGNKELSVENGKLRQKKEYVIRQLSELQTCKNELQSIINTIMEKKNILFSEVSLKAQQLSKIQFQVCQYNEQIQMCQINLVNKQQKLSEISQQIQRYEHRTKQSRSRLQMVVQELQFNRDEEENLQERVNALRKLQKRLIVEYGMKGIKLDQQVKVKLQQTLNQVMEVQELRDKLKREKQQNRKLKQDIEKMRKNQHF